MMSRFNAHPDSWSDFSAKKKVKYMEALKKLYGDTHDTEVKGTNNGAPDRKAGTGEALCLAEEK